MIINQDKRKRLEQKKKKPNSTGVNKCRYIVLAATISEDDSSTPMTIFFENLTLLVGLNLGDCYLIKMQK